MKAFWQAAPRIIRRVTPSSPGVGRRPIATRLPLIYHKGMSTGFRMEIIMQPGLEARCIEQDLQDLDDTDLAILRAEKRIAAQELRIAQLNRDGIDSASAQAMLANMREGLKELIMHRALIVHGITYREP